MRNVKVVSFTVGPSTGQKSVCPIFFGLYDRLVKKRVRALFALLDIIVKREHEIM